MHLMKNDPHIRPITLAGPQTTMELKKHPFMGLIFLKALFISLFRSNTIANDAVVKKNRIILKNYQPDKELIADYKNVCSFSTDRPDNIPISYLQTLFISLLGRFITASFFPINPLGLIQIFQSFELKRPVTTDEILDLTCTLASIKKTEKGIETHFTLEVISGHEVIWQGTSIFFTRNPVKNRAEKKKRSNKKDDIFLEKKETLFIPSGTGRLYAKVSGDYNPHHLYTILAKLFGFKKAIAHGMWSLARVVAILDREFDIYGSARVEASFKLPIFMPATTALGYECRTDDNTHQTIVNFELRDELLGLPHLKGKLLYNNQGE